MERGGEMREGGRGGCFPCSHKDGGCPIFLFPLSTFPEKKRKKVVQIYCTGVEGGGGRRVYASFPLSSCNFPDLPSSIGFFRLLACLPNPAVDDDAFVQTAQIGTTRQRKQNTRDCVPKKEEKLELRFLIAIAMWVESVRSN